MLHRVSKEYDLQVMGEKNCANLWLSKIEIWLVLLCSLAIKEFKFGNTESEENEFSLQYY